METISENGAGAITHPTIKGGSVFAEPVCYKQTTVEEVQKLLPAVSGYCWSVEDTGEKLYGCHMIARIIAHKEGQEVIWPEDLQRNVNLHEGG